MTIPLRVLLVEDSADDAFLAIRELQRSGYAPDWKRTDCPTDLALALSSGTWDVILADYTLPGFSGGAALEMVQRAGIDTPFIFVSGTIGEDRAVQAMKRGAHDYVLKGRLWELAPAVERELRDAQVRRERRAGEEALRRAHEELERRVEERTAELTEANRRLREEMAGRSRVEAQLLQGQKLQAIGQLAAGIAHEINNPVAYVLSNLNSLQETLDELAGSSSPELLEDHRSAIRDSIKGAGRIRDIVRSLREFSHPDEGELNDVDLRKTIEEALRVCTNEVKHKADVVRDFVDMPPVRGYPQRIEQVFVNMIMNGAQAIRGRGKLFLSTRHEGREAVVRIRDTGHGIPPEHVKRIFEPFFTTKPVGQGTGLGLHVAYKIIQAHDGRIEIASEVGTGTEMTVRLPFRGPAGP